MMTIISNRYRLDREIGRGASGAVWVADDDQLRRRVAIKLLRLDLMSDPELCARFEREGRHIAKLQSPHAVQVYDAGVDGAQPYIVMELLEGESLDARLRRHPLLPVEVATGILTDVAKGLRAMHSAGLVHRDLKPANVFLALDSDRELAKLVDFGLSHVVQPKGNDAVSHGTGILGTPLYMSPEQITGGRVDQRTDVWALGVLAYEMLTGEHPFQSEQLPLLREKIRTAGFIRPSQVAPALGAAFDEFFERALAVNPDARFQSATQFAAELKQLTSSGGPRVIRLLYLDDEPDMKLLLQRRFRDELRDGRYELFFASDGNAGLRELAMRPEIDVVLTDINMPGMDGLTFLEHVPEINPLVRVVVVSAYSDMTNIRIAMNRGAFDFLVKPIDFEDLQRTIEKCANHAAVLRRAFRANEENEILRALVGPQSVDKVVASVRTADVIEHETVDATIAFIGVHSFSQRVDGEPPDQLLAELNELFQIFAREVLNGGGTVGRLMGEVMLASFQGEEHAARAGDTAIAIRDRLRALNDRRADDTCEVAASIGLAVGSLVSGGVGSRSLGWLERTFLGRPVNRAAVLQRAALAGEVLILAEDRTVFARTHTCEQVAERRVRLGEQNLSVVRVAARARVSGWRELPLDSGVATAGVPIAQAGRD